MDTEKIAAARLQATLTHPYLATALFALSPVARPGIATLAVDEAWRLYVDPAVVSAWSVAQLGAVLIHEVGHLLRDHAGRGRAIGAERSAWNIAADLEINDDLEQERLPLPGDYLSPRRLGLAEHRLAEEYYGDLAFTVGSGGCSEEESTNCGSGAHGCVEAWDEEGTGLCDSPAVSEGEAAAIRHRVAGDIVAAAGTVPGGWKRWAEARFAHQRDWRRELAAAVARPVARLSGAWDYSYARPSRRAACLPAVIRPAMVRPVPRVAVVVDTSASMDQGCLERATAEVSGVLRALAGHPVTVLACDAAVHTCRVAFRADQLILAGGGGTDMTVGIAASARLRPRPDVVVVMTDGYTPWPQRCPSGMRIVVVLIGDGGDAPGWARTVRVPAGWD